MTVDELLSDTRSELAAQGTERRRMSTLRFFKEHVDCYGVSSPQLKVIEKRIAPDVKLWPVPQRNRFCTQLLKSGKLEEANLAVYVYQRFARTCGECEFRLFAQWMSRYVNNWSTCDGLSVWLIGETLVRHPGLVPEVATWTESPNRWVRRSAAVSMIPFARRGQQNEAILRVALKLLPDADEMVQKGVGWLLKKTYPKRPEQTVEFLCERPVPTTRLVLRYAAENMSDADRRKVLG